MRRGVTIVELSVAILLAGVVLAGVGQLLAVTAAQQREGHRRLTAMHEAANHMERLAALPWSDLTPERAAEFRLSDEAVSALPGAILTVRVREAETAGSEQEADDPLAALAARRLEVAVTWRNAAGRQVDPVRLTAWRFSPEGAP